MSTLAEIQEAITRLPATERDALSVWIHSQSTPQMSPADEELLLQSLDEAARDVDSRKGVSIQDVRKRVASWVAR